MNEQREERIRDNLRRFFDASHQLASSILDILLDAQAVNQAESKTRIGAGAIAPEIVEKDGLMTVKQAAEFLNVSEHTIYNWIKRGTITPLKFDQEWRFSRGQLMSDGRKITGSKRPLRVVK